MKVRHTMKLDKKTHDRLNMLLIMVIYNDDKYAYWYETGEFIEIDAEMLRYMAYWLKPVSLTPIQSMNAQILLETGKW